MDSFRYMEFASSPTVPIVPTDNMKPMFVHERARRDFRDGAHHSIHIATRADDLGGMFARPELFDRRDSSII